MTKTFGVMPMALPYLTLHLGWMSGDIQH